MAQLYAPAQFFVGPGFVFFSSTIKDALGTSLLPGPRLLTANLN
jgi:hypothetical protein